MAVTSFGPFRYDLADATLERDGQTVAVNKRGLLLLTVLPSPEPDPRVRLLRGVPSKRPPASVVEGDELDSIAPAERRVSVAVVVVAVVVAVWVLLLIWLRLSGRG